MSGPKKRVLKEYVFEQRIRETIMADSEEQARKTLEETYGEADDFELLNVTTFKEQ